MSKKRKGICPDCKSKSLITIHARGLCKKHYDKKRFAENLPPLITCTMCGGKIEHFRNNLCNACRHIEGYLDNVPLKVNFGVFDHISWCQRPIEEF
jgi:hypothetical protein